jgi:hypothetical protein
VEEEVLLQNWAKDNVTYIIYGHEVGNSGTPHLQGYLEVNSKTGLRPLKRKIGLDRIHLEPSRGSLESNQKYCKKEDPNWFEEGTPMRQVGFIFLE